MNKPTKPEEVTHWIDRYLSGELTIEESNQFEAALLEDYRLANAFEEQAYARKMLAEVFKEEKLRAQIKQFQLQEKRKRVFKNVIRYAAAASVLIIGSLSFLLKSMPVFPDSENDFTVIRSADETVMRPDRKLVFDRFFSGQAHIAEGQYALAATNFEKVLEEQDLRPYFREAAEWHLIVAYLKSGSLNKANELYTRFSNCTDCEYEVSRVNRWKIWLQIQYSLARSRQLS